MGLDVIIPVYNEGDNIRSVLDSLKESVNTSLRILICYDDDNDNTLQALETYPQDTFKILPVKNRGIGAHGAILTGFKESSEEAVLVMPADDTYNAVIIDEMYKKFREGNDIVAASRFMPGGRMEGAPALKNFLVRGAAFTMYYLARLPVHDPSNGFRLFSRKVIDTIRIESTQGFVYSIELLVKCHRLGWKIAEVPSKWFERTKGKSRFKVAEWLPSYLKWYFFAFATTYFRKK